MKKLLFLIVFIVIAIILIAQETQHEAVAINIEVPVRVYKGNNFVDDLTINDFEIYEDGVLQEIEAVYFINKMNIQRKEEKQTLRKDEEQKFKPETARSFYLFFEVVKYSPKLNKAIEYFFQNVLMPSDNLTIVTPMSTYGFKSEFFSNVTTEEAINQIREILRKDAWNGTSEYRRLNNELKRLVRIMGGSKDRGPGRPVLVGGKNVAISLEGSEGDPMVNLAMYEEILIQLESIRKVDKKRLLDFAQHLKDQPGQKYVFLFYQREFIPQLTSDGYFKLLDKLDEPTKMKLMTLMGYYFRDIGFDFDSIKQAYADSSISINFLFFTKPANYIPGVQMVEHSEDIFSVFREMAQATGGITTSSSNPKYLFQRASDAVESYYLLFYSPKNYKADGKFKKIKVKVKGKNYRVAYRAGYIAD